MSTSNPWLWAIPALPFATFLLNGGLYLAACSAYARKHASAGGHGHDHGGHDHDHGGHDHAHGGHDHAHGDHAHGDHGHGHDDHAHAHATPGERVGLPAPVVAVISLIGPVLAFALSVKALLDAHHAASVGHYFEWIHAGSVSVAFALQVDPLTAVMLMNVAGVGSLIHLYSYGYMKDDIAYPRFMAYLNLFLSAMLILVMADNLPLMFVGWEGVGVCSYLLISFWYHDPPNVDAARKAFVVNRVGDLAFLLGVFGLFSLYGSLDFAGIEAGIGHADLSTVVAHGPLAGQTLGGALAFCAGCLFFGATGKSAQIPLYTWLPDAMAGPTPVSALIHAATMVTAGVYLLGRLDFLYVLLPQVTAVVALVAAATALLSGTIAVAQTDIKKVLAYSTVSQLGFMFCGMASALFVGGLFHVVTHAFFKALLFLGAGAVIHALGGEQDIRKMGGLRKDMPLVAGLFAIGSLALAGVPPFAGFWSKDEVLAGVHLQMSTAGGLWVAVWWMLVLTALLTAFYTTRLVVMVFFGPPADPNRHPHPVHWSMTSVLAVLAVLSAFGGGLAGPLEHFTHPVWAHADIPHETLHASHNIAMAFSMTVVAIGVGSAAFLYGVRRELVTNLVSGPLAGVHRLVENKFLVDELYDAVVVAPTGMLANVLFREVDRKAIDATLVEGPGKAALAVGALLQRTQAGPVAAATAGMSVGAAAVLGYLLWVAYV